MTRGESERAKRDDIRRGEALRKLRGIFGEMTGVRRLPDGRTESYVWRNGAIKHVHYGRTWQELVDKANKKAGRA